jgi:hypothetical protein
VSGPPGSYRALRETLQAMDPAARVGWLTDWLRRDVTPPGRDALPGPWRLAQSLILSDPKPLAQACTALLEDAQALPIALEMLCRLHNRHESFDALRALLLRFADAPAEGAQGRRLRLLRTELLAPSATAEARAAHWALGAAALSPLGAASYAFQRAPEDSVPVAFTQALEAACAEAALPPGLIPLAEAESVAVVGNGGSLRGTGAAAAIEAHGCVVRMNYPVLSGFEADVGRRTDLVLFAEAKRGELPNLLARESEYPSLPAFAVRMSWTPAARAAPPGVVPRALADAVGAIAYDRPTTGFFAIVLIAVLLRRKVTLFGFDFFAPGQPGHYFGDATAATPHEIAYERWFAAQILPRLAPSLSRG